MKHKYADYEYDRIISPLDIGRLWPKVDKPSVQKTAVGETAVKVDRCATVIVS
jgi:hypothetical protein